MDFARLLVVRHGQSTWNADGRWQGTLDPPLSKLGIRQAKEAAEVVGGFDAIVSSALDRAHTTASIIAEAVGIGPVVIHEDLHERHAGDFQGLTKSEIEERWPGALAEHREPEGWESDADVVARAIGALGSIAASVGVGGTALVVSHGGVIRCLELLLGLERRPIPNLGGRWFHVGPGRFDAHDEVLLVEPQDVTIPRQL